MLFVFLLYSTLADQVVACVGDDIVLQSEVDENALFLASDPAAQKVFTDPLELRRYVIDELISRKLLLQTAEKESIEVAQEEISARADQMLESVKERFPSEADFIKALQEQNLTTEDLKKNYESSLKTQLIMQKIIQKKLATKIMISPIRVKDFYEENKDSIAILPGKAKLAHILIPLRPSEDELKTGFNRALEVYRLLSMGSDFGVIAEKFSEDENSKNRGGMLGKIRKGETLEEFEKVVFELKPGTLSQPFPTRLGYHLVEVLNRGPDWVLLRQILIKVKITKADTLRHEKLAQKLADLIDQGADFDSLAKLYSEDPNIDLGEFYLDQLTSPFNEVVTELAPGQVSKPTLTPYGYHLIFVKEKVAERTLSFDEMRDQIYQYLYQQELQKYYTQLIEEYKRKTFVSVIEKIS